MCVPWHNLDGEVKVNGSLQADIRPTAFCNHSFDLNTQGVDSGLSDDGDNWTFDKTHDARMIVFINVGTIQVIQLRCIRFFNRGHK